MFCVGHCTGLLLDHNREDWDGAKPRPICWACWYPSQSTGACSTAPQDGIFHFPDVQIDSTLNSTNQTWPLVLLSHGTGGSTQSLAWLAAGLVKAGYICVSIDHHGNNANEAYRAEGFACWWERAADFSCLLDNLAQISPVTQHVDGNRISAIGFSLGGHTVMALAGALSSMELFDDYLRQNPSPIDGPKEFPDLSQYIPSLMKNSSTFRHSWQRHGQSFHDSRVNRVVAIAPAPPVRAFVPDSVAAIPCPILILCGEADTEASFDQCAKWLNQQNDNFTLYSMGKHTGHYTFLPVCTAMGHRLEPGICTDNVGTNRAKIHRQSIALIVDFLGWQHKRASA